MHRAISIGLGLLGSGVAAALATPGRYEGRLDRIEAALRGPARAGPRRDLPPEVVALAARLGASSARESAFVEFEQSGQMWSAPDADPMAFLARQTVSTGAPAILQAHDRRARRIRDAVEADDRTRGEPQPIVQLFKHVMRPGLLRR